MLTVPIAALHNFAGQLDRRADALSPHGESDSGDVAHKQLADAYFQLGKRMDEAGFVEDGLACYRKALRVAGSDPDLHFDILFKLERLNRVDEAWDALLGLERATGTPCAANHKLYILKARLEYRLGNPESARAMLEQFLQVAPNHSHRYLACGWLGTVLDESGHYDAAMDAFDAKNEALLRMPGTAGLLRENDAQLEALAVARHWYCKRTSFGWQDASAPNDSPILLVGFPRSGTTLLDQLLDSHPDLSVIEEKPMLNGIRERFYGSEERLASLQDLDEQEIVTYRRLYWSNVSAFLGRAPAGTQVVDKLPLNITLLDLYIRLFPRAKIIVALRDPRDVILSNYMQLYKLNPSMAANLSLVRSARYYAAVMDLYLLFRKFVPDNIHEVRYESLVHDFEAEGAQLMRFLGLEWKDELLNFHANAQRRWIATPSYHQATKPIYRTAVGRWKHYQTRMADVLPLLQPYLEAFGGSA